MTIIIVVVVITIIIISMVIVTAMASQHNLPHIHTHNCHFAILPIYIYSPLRQRVSVRVSCSLLYRSTAGQLSGEDIRESVNNWLVFRN